MDESIDFLKENVFWNNFYANNKNPFIPSAFAQFILQYLRNGSTLCELGCGNGRDAVFFASKNIFVDAYDLAKDEIEYLSYNYGKNNLRFLYGDFTQLPLPDTQFDSIYSRFTIHSIPQAREDVLLDWISSSLKSGGYFFVESRSIHDPLLNKGKKISNNANFTDHYRRYMDISLFCSKLISKGFCIIYSQESNAFAVTENETPMIARIVAQKKG